jgi:hypothetical protein
MGKVEALGHGQSFEHHAPKGGVNVKFSIAWRTRPMASPQD